MPDIPSTSELLATAVAAIGGVDRPGQERMVQAVDAAIDAGEHLVIQAGTGTGKSLGYLVPLARHAVTTGRPVAVSTATLALQAQLVTNDLPAVSEALKAQLGRPVTFGLVKGRSNYLCVHKLAGGFPDEQEGLFDLPPMPGQSVTPPPATSRLGKEVVRLRKWAANTASGDRDDLAAGVSDRAWREVSVTAQECLGSKCPMATECFVEKSRAAARDVDIVVTNHALLAIDAFEDRSILPDYDVLVVDEAHELVDRVTSVVSAQLSPSMVTAAANRASKQGGAAADRLRTAGDDLTDSLTGLPQRRYGGGLPDHVLTVVEMVASAARETLTSLRQGATASDSSDGGVQLARAAVQEVLEVADRLVGSWEYDVIWYHENEIGNSVRRTLNVAPLGVAHLLAGRLFEEGPPVVLTSATLAIGGTFDAVSRQLGLSLLSDERSWQSEDVGSPFDYAKQAILYVAKHLPAPGRDGLAPATLDEIADLVTAAGGRTLGLFSSRRAAEQAAQELRGRLEVPILCQGEDAMPNLVRTFGEDEATCLFGTLTLWQGVDVPGPSCSLVIVDRLPFPRPDDPLMSARTESVEKNGGNGFMAVSAHYAALRLAQGSGRLIRRDTDRGVVAVLDPRLATARYGEFVTRSLPPMWRTVDKVVVVSALRRLAGT